MSDREELIALRRMAELEDRAQKKPTPVPTKQTAEQAFSGIIDTANRWEKNLDNATSAGGRALLEGTAAVPGQIYNVAQIPRKVTRWAANKVLPEGLQIPDAQGLLGSPGEMDTQKYGTQVADTLNLNKGDERFMRPARAAAGVLVPGALLSKFNLAKTAIGQMMGAGAPLKAAMTTAAGASAGEVAKEAGANEAGQLIANVAGSVLAAGVPDVASYILQANRRGGGALGRILESSAKSKGKPVSQAVGDFSLTPTTREFVPGTAPTAAMAYSNPEIQVAERMARLQNKPAFFERDMANRGNIYQAIRGKAEQANPRAMKDTLNELTSPLREEAISAARGGEYAGPMAQQINTLRTSPGSRYNEQLNTVLKGGERLLSEPNIDPLDVYTYKKALDDAVVHKGPITSDKLTNAVKNSYRETNAMRDAITEGMDTASGGKWRAYLNEHAKGMKPVNDQEAWIGLQNKFALAPELEQGLPNVAPAALRRGIEQVTKGERGQDLLLPESRSLVNKLLNTSNAIETARSTGSAIEGSQTAPLLMEAIQAATPTGGTAKSMYDWAKRFASGDSALNDALLNPEKLPALLKEAQRSGDTYRAKIIRSVMESQQSTRKR